MVEARLLEWCTSPALRYLQGERVALRSRSFRPAAGYPSIRLSTSGLGMTRNSPLLELHAQNPIQLCPVRSNISEKSPLAVANCGLLTLPGE